MHVDVLTRLLQARALSQHVEGIVIQRRGAHTASAYAFLIALVSVIFAWPYSRCMMFVDVNYLLNTKFGGIGICVPDKAQYLSRFMRVTFLLLFVTPLLYTFGKLSACGHQIDGMVRELLRPVHISHEWETLATAPLLDRG